MTRPAEYTRQSIIKAAVHLFAEKGFENASVRDIDTLSYLTAAVDIVRRIPPSRHTKTSCPVRGHLADGPMQRFRAEPRTIRARAI